MFFNVGASKFSFYPPRLLLFPPFRPAPLKPPCPRRI
jgi:hypothetical protein